MDKRSHRLVNGIYKYTESRKSKKDKKLLLLLPFI